MIIWLNGPFGVGKTSVARILVERLGSALLYDPEPFGAALRAVLAPMDVADDFQELRAWPALVVRTAAVIQQTYGRTLVMPMTVLDHARCDALTTDLRDIDSELHLFQLTAREETLRTRILRRPEIDGPHAWCLEHLEQGLRLCSDEGFGEVIETDQLQPQQIASAILKRVADRGHRQLLRSDEPL